MKKSKQAEPAHALSSNGGEKTMTLENMLKTLTLDQKLAQLSMQGSPAFFLFFKEFDAEKARREYPNGIFGMMVPIDLTPVEIGNWTNQMLDCFADLSPIPPVLICESLHGVLGKGTTVFPQSIGMGASFDPDLMRRVAEAIGREAKALGIRMSFAPDLDLGREPRWGRIEETYGEAPLLVAEMGAAYVKGLLADDNRYAATVKHFAAHGSPESGVNLAPVNASLFDLEDKFLPPFKRALESGAMAVMPAYSAFNGIPCHVHPLLMQTILRERWGFDGVVISDFGALQMLASFHSSAANADDAGLLSIASGVGVEAPSLWGYSRLKTLVEDGRLPVDIIDKAVLRILKMKMELGLFERKRVDIEHIRRVVNCDEHKALAREAARKSIVLLKNKGFLPFKAGMKLAVIGPNAFSAQLGDYALPKLDATTPVEAIAERAEKSGGSVVFAKGCEVFGSDISGFAEAERVARESDAVICLIGGKSMKGYGVGWGSEEESMLTCGEGCDMHDLTPGGPQLDLVRRLIATGKPVTVVMIDGRPETLFDVAEQCDALIAAWYPGEEGSHALADLLFGDHNFSAKLPVTFPRHVGQVPLCHDRVPSAGGFYHSPGTPEKPGRDYVFLRTDPAFEFGYGIGYSDIAYRSITAERVKEGVSVSLKLENTGAYSADEAVLIFIQDETASIPQPVKKLAAIWHVVLDPGEIKSVKLIIPEEQLMFTDTSLRKKLEAGWFKIMCGGLDMRLYVGGRVQSFL